MDSYKNDKHEVYSKNNTHVKNTPVRNTPVRNTPVRNTPVRNTPDTKINIESKNIPHNSIERYNLNDIRILHSLHYTSF